MVGQCRLLVTGMLLATTAMAHSETLEEYVKKCDRAIGVTVPQFNCDMGKVIPTTHFASGRCDRPNVLNSVCDPNSTFQVLSDPDDPGSNNVSIVALCRKKDKGPGKYGDIAVIQHNRKNGATCFYQALPPGVGTASEGDLNGVDVQPPSKGERGFWMSPASIVAPTFGAPCGSCHDNGPIIRSPYLNQLSAKPHALPGADDDTFNSDGEPYYFVGSDFGRWKAYKVEVSRNICNDCHRMGVNNLRFDDRGTSRDFARRSTDRTQEAKNPHSASSPIWMPPRAIDGSNGDSCTPVACTKFSQTHFDAAMAIKDCADQFSESGPLPRSDSCKITQFSGPARAPTLGLGGQLTTDPGIGANADGRLEIFVRWVDNALWHIAQNTLGGWSVPVWESLSGQLAGNVAVGRNADGRLEVFARGIDSALWHIWQTSPNGGWAQWASLGGKLTSDPVAQYNTDGRLEVFARGTDNALWHIWQTRPNGGWSGWASRGGALPSKPSVGMNSDGRLEVFIRGLDNALWHISQTAPNGEWSRWLSLGGQLTSDPVVDTNADGRLEVFARGANKALWHIWQTRPNGGWSGWDSLGGQLTGNLAVGRNADGALEVYVQGTDNALWRNVQNGSRWSGWDRLGGQLTNNLVVGRNADGRLEVFVRGGDNELWHNWLVPGWN
jgi:hypothetical protein